MQKAASGVKSLNLKLSTAISTAVKQPIETSASELASLVVLSTELARLLGEALLTLRATHARLPKG